MKAIFATDLAHGMGLEGRLPWPKNKRDFSFFKEKTCNNYIAMGRATWDTLPVLPYRIPIVVTSTPLQGVRVLHSSHYVDKLQELDEIVEQDIYLIGGAKLLTPQALNACTNIYHTCFKGTFNADTFMNQDSMATLNTRQHDVIYEDDLIIIRDYHAKL